MEKHLLFTFLIFIHSCINDEGALKPKLVRVKNIKPLEVFVQNSLIISKDKADESFVPIIVEGGEGNVDIEIVDGPGEITSTKKHKFVFKSHYSGETTIKVEDDIGQVVTKVINSEAPYKINLSKKFISRNPSKQNQVLINIVGGDGKSVISLGDGSLGNIVNNKLYIPPTAPSEKKERIRIIAEDENGNKAFETLTLYPGFRVKTDKMELTANSPFSEDNKIRVNIFGGVNILNNNSGIKVQFKKGQILLFKKISRNQIVFYPPRKKTHKIANIVISDDIGNKQHLKILINDPISASISERKVNSDLIEVDLRINGGSGKVNLEKEINDSTSLPNIKKAGINHFILNNQVDGSAFLRFKDSNGSDITYNVIVRDSLVYLKRTSKHFENKNFIVYLFKKSEVKLNYEIKNLKIREIGENRISLFSDKEGEASLKIIDKKNNNEIDDQFEIFAQPRFKLVDPIDYLDSYEPDAFEQIGKNNTGYTKFKLTDFSCGISIKLEFPENYFSDKSLSCDANQIELRRNIPFYSIRSPSSINFKQHKHSQIVHLQSETRDFSLLNSSAYLLKKNPISIQSTVTPYESVTKGDVSILNEGNKTLTLEKGREGVCIGHLTDEKKSSRCFPKNYEYLQENKKNIYFLQKKEDEISIIQLSKEKTSNDIITIKTFVPPSKNFILSNAVLKGDELIFQLTYSNKDLSSNSYNLETTLFHLNTTNSNFVHYISYTIPITSKAHLTNNSFYFLSKNLNTKEYCLTKFNLDKEKESSIYCHTDLKAFHPISEGKFILLKKENNFWFDQKTEKVVYRDYIIHLDILEQGLVKKFTSISPEEVFHQAKCEKSIDVESFHFFHMNDSIYLVFNQKGNFIGHNFSPIFNNDKNTIGILRIDLSNKKNLIYRQLSSPYKGEINSHFGKTGSYIIGTSQDRNKLNISALHDGKEIINYIVEELSNENLEN